MNTSNEETETLSSEFADSSKKSIEALKEEIEQINDEHVVVELARIYAVRDYEATQSQRREDAAKHSERMKTIQTKKKLMVEEIEAAKELGMKLAITEANIKKLEKQLKEEEHGRPCCSLPLMESLTKESEETKKELSLVKDESFRYMDFMDDIRKELSHVAGEALCLKKKEDKSKARVYNLDSKLLRSKAKLEEKHEALNKVRFTVSSLTDKLEHLLSEAEAAKKELSAVSEEVRDIKCETEVRKNRIRKAKERLQAARKELKAVNSSEPKALDNLRAITEFTTKSRALLPRSKPSLRISKLEYEYLKNHAEDAKDIADKKVDAACAWTKALIASQEENQMQIERLCRETMELKAKKERNRPEDPTNDVVRDSNQEMGIETSKRERMVSNSSRAKKERVNKMTPTRQTRARRLAASPLVGRGGTPRATPIMVRRRRKVVRNLAKFFGVRKDV